MWVIILCFLAVLSASKANNNDEYISLIAPPAIFSNKPYSAFLATSNFQKSTDMVISLRKEQGFYRIRKGQETRQTHIVTFDKAGVKSFTDKGKNFDGQTGFPLKFLARQDGKCINKKIVILNTPREHHTFIQLDKPIYKPNDEIKYRVYVLDHDTKPVAINSIKVEIKDNEDNVVERQKELNNQTFKDEGLFESTFKLSDNINLGYWTITAEINGNKKMFAEKKVQVDKVKLPFFEVVIDAAKNDFYLDDKFIDIEVYGKYAFGEYTKGRAKVTITNNHSGILLYEENIFMDAKKNLKLNIQDDLKIMFIPTGELKLTIDVSLDDKVVGKIERAQKDINLYSRRKNTIEIRKFYPFQEGLEYTFAVAVYDPSKKQIKSSNEPVKLTYSIKLYNGVQIDKGIHGNITKGLARFKIPAYEDIKELKNNLKFMEDEIEETIKPNLALTGALRVSVKPIFVSNENQDIKVTIEYQHLSEIVVLAIGRMGIVYSTTHNCLGENVCQFSLDDIKKHYEDLKPEAKIVVYSIEHYSKQVLYGSAVFRFDGFSENQLKINVSKEGKPKDLVTIEFKSKKDSIVSILAIDKKLTFLANGHDITREDVINALTNTKKLVYKRNEKDDVIFDKANNNFIINLPLDKWRDCSQSETELLSKIDNPAFPGRTDHGGTYYEIDQEDFEEIEQGLDITSPEEKDVRKFFPETWIWESNKLTDGDSQTIDQKVPDSMTTWLFTGISIHKDYGLAIAKPQELVVSQEFFIELNLPYSIKFGEMLNLKVIAFNYIRGEFAGNLEAKINIIAQQEGEKQQFKMLKLIDATTNCQTQDIPSTTFLKTVNIPQKSGITEKILIKPLINEKIKIRIEAEATVTKNGKSKTFSDKIVRELIVENEGVAYFETKNYEFKFNSNNYAPKFFSNAFEVEDVKEGSIDLTAVVTGDMMGPALNFYNGLFQLPDGCGEQIMATYAKTLWLYMYLRNTGKITSTQENEAKRNLKTGYQRMMRHKKSDGSFAIYSESEGSTWLNAYTSRIFGSAMQFGIEPINTELIRKALSICISNQNADGSFLEGNNQYIPHPDGEEPTSRPKRFTAFVLLALLKNKDYVGVPFTDAIEKGFNYIENRLNYDNYGAAISAYAAAIAKRKTTVDSLLDTLYKRSETDGENRYWNIKKGVNTYENTQVEISAYAAMAYMEDGKLDKAEPIIRWLMKKRNPQGGFGNSHSTAVAMEALAMMASKTGSSDTQMKFEFITNSTQKIEHNLNAKNALKPHLIKMPKSTLNMTIKGQGKGYGVVTTYYEYYKNVKEVSDTFELTVTPGYDSSGSKKVRACVQRKQNTETSPVVMMEFNLVSGYIYESRSNPMQQNKHIQNVELRRGGTLIDLYFDEIAFGSPQCVDIYVKKGFDILEQKKASVKVYEYNKKEETFTSSFYNIESGACN